MALLTGFLSVVLTTIDLISFKSLYSDGFSPFANCFLGSKKGKEAYKLQFSLIERQFCKVLAFLKGYHKILVTVTVRAKSKQI